MLNHLKSSESWNQKSIGAKGFTLIELLVVIVILGVLGAVVVFSVRGVTTKSKDNACLTEKRSVATAIEAYYADQDTYPASGDLAKLETFGLINDATDIAATSYSWDVNTGKVTQVTCPS